MKSAFSQKKRAVSFRLNPLKWSHEEIQKDLEKASINYTQLNFPKDAYILDDSFSESDLWKRKIYKDWKIYLQNISSQIPILFFTDISSIETDLDKGKKNTLKILDACAAPGGKTSQLAAMYPDAEIYAFEPGKIRYDKMCHNLKKLGCKNVTMIHSSIENIKTYISEKNYFDMILIDAPCSWEGSILYKNTKFLEDWNISHIKKNYTRQKSICDTVIPYLKNSWEMIYSTCTLAPEENESVIHYMLCHYPELFLKKIDLLENKHIKTKESLKIFGKQTYKTDISQKTIRVIPSKYSEWFFIAKFKKCENDMIS